MIYNSITEYIEDSNNPDDYVYVVSFLADKSRIDNLCVTTPVGLTVVDIKAIQDFIGEDFVAFLSIMAFDPKSKMLDLNQYREQKKTGYTYLVCFVLQQDKYASFWNSIIQVNRPMDVYTINHMEEYVMEKWGNNYDVFISNIILVDGTGLSESVYSYQSPSA